jgi:predicted 2-oxoglutarate/Fe(II)-dependent dioxygenase YbiX
MQLEIAERLWTIAPPGSFAVQRSAPAEALRIDVDGVGALDLPLAPPTVSRLREVAKPARYGLRDRTVYDTTVRDSREIARSRIRIDQRRWNATLVPLLDEIRAGLGLAEGVVLKAELHNMLLYERGQFFKSHQDSEKAEGMIGTLVVTLPSSFRGGEMTVEQHGELMAFRGSRSELQLVAFYADCRHEVRPVTGGARVVLTYNLLTQGVAAADHVLLLSCFFEPLSALQRMRLDVHGVLRKGGARTGAPHRVNYVNGSEIAAGFVLGAAPRTDGAAALEATHAVARDVDRLDDRRRRTLPRRGDGDEPAGGGVTTDLAGRHGAPHRSRPALKSAVTSSAPAPAATAASALLKSTSAARQPLGISGSALITVSSGLMPL